ncbi:MAG: hypothetical protein KJO29_05855, partial [Bacteroidia bacterium]|nr:hypothetical protein [Bacteroidia bacterium]
MEKKKQLTSGEIEKLFDFVRSKNVPYKDVQYEIVDHLASGIEEIQSEEPGISFEKALAKIYSKFPITGFAVLQLEKEKYIKSYWRKRLGKYMLKFFQLPRIILTILLFLILFKIFTIYGWMSVWISGISCLIVMFYSIKRSNWLSSHSDNYLIIKSFNSSIRFYVIFILVLTWFIGQPMGIDLYNHSEGSAVFLNYFFSIVYALAW